MFTRHPARSQLMSRSVFRYGGFLIHAEKSFSVPELSILRMGGTDAILLVRDRCDFGAWKVTEA